MISSKNKSSPIVLVDPRFAIKWRDIDDFLGEFGPFNGRYVPRYPSDWGLQLKKYVYEGTYNKETDTFMTTSLAVNQKLEELPKYRTLIRTINNLNKNIEKIAYLCDLSYYLGNTPTNKLHRKTTIS